MKIIVRRAKLSDVEGIRRLISLYAREKRLLKRRDAEIKKLIRSFFVAEADGAVEGCVALEVYSKKLAEVRSLAVSPQMKGLDIGGALVKLCLRRAKSRGVKEVMAITSSAEKFFEKQGFGFALPNERKALFYWTK